MKIIIRPKNYLKNWVISDSCLVTGSRHIDIFIKTQIVNMHLVQQGPPIWNSVNLSLGNRKGDDKLTLKILEWCI